MNNSGVNTIILVLIFALVIFGMVWFIRGGAEEPQQDGFNVELNIPTPDGDSKASQ